ncbi:MAG TPA: bifunctional hydroxymethylpyrimidine kinase/phosphomethylpyrimidine kinase, partial [Rudaea sp.]|nr:bifunctional hydroxymethylpyrimidine kinase/phosphomethylpyrimidine kinase [Rudaea sp.]
AETAARLRQLGAASVLLKGGHGRGAQVVDVLIDAQGVRRFSHPRLRFAAHGTGCVLSAAIAAGLAKGRSRRAAVADAERYLQGALRRAYRAGKNAVRVIPQQLSTS